MQRMYVLTHFFSFKSVTYCNRTACKSQFYYNKAKINSTNIQRKTKGKILTINKAGGQNIAKFLCRSRALLKIRDFMDGK